MSSGFVSSGSLEGPTENDEWKRVKKELDEERKRKTEKENQHGGKSLYEVLEANKAAKQEAFEESMKIKNQFRALEDDEVEFLDSVLESQREKDRALKEETDTQLATFREQREQTERATLDTHTVNLDVPAEWGISGKRKKRGTESGPVKGLKLRKTSLTTASPESSKIATARSEIQKADEKDSMTTMPESVSKTTSISPHTSSLGLGAYSSDEDEE